MLRDTLRIEIYGLTDVSVNVKPRVLHVEGNPDDPVNKGTLCPEGAIPKDFTDAPTRLKKPLYRPPSAKEWKEISQEEALGLVARENQARIFELCPIIPDGSGR